MDRFIPYEKTWPEFRNIYAETWREHVEEARDLPRLKRLLRFYYHATLKPTCQAARVLDDWREDLESAER